MFAKEVYRDLYFVAKNSAEALEYLMTYVPFELDTKWFQVPSK
jgi:hypothetical protein